MNGVSAVTVSLLRFTGRLPTPNSPGTVPSWLVAFNAVIGLVGYLWIDYLLTCAVHDALDLDVRRARFVAGLVIAVPILYSVSPLL